MSTTETVATVSTSTAAKTDSPNARRVKRAEGRKKRVLKLKTDPAFAKQFFENKSKKALEKKSSFRRKKNKKK